MTLVLAIWLCSACDLVLSLPYRIGTSAHQRAGRGLHDGSTGASQRELWRDIYGLDVVLDNQFGQQDISVAGRQRVNGASPDERRGLEQMSALLLSEVEDEWRGRAAPLHSRAQALHLNNTTGDAHSSNAPSLLELPFTFTRDLSKTDTLVYGITGSVFMLSFFFFLCQCVTNKGAKMFDVTTVENGAEDVFNCCECICGVLGCCVYTWEVCGPCCHTFCCLMLAWLSLMVAYLWALGVIVELRPFIHLYFCIFWLFLGTILIIAFQVYRHVILKIEANANFYEKKFKSLEEAIDQTMHPLMRDAKKAENDFKAWC